MRINAATVDVGNIQDYPDWGYDTPPEAFLTKTGISSLDDFLEDFAARAWFAGCANGAKVAVEQAKGEMKADACFVDDSSLALWLWNEGLLCEYRLSDILEESVAYACTDLVDDEARHRLLALLRRQADALQSHIGPDPDDLLK